MKKIKITEDELNEIAMESDLSFGTTDFKKGYRRAETKLLKDINSLQKVIKGYQNAIDSLYNSKI